MAENKFPLKDNHFQGGSNLTEPLSDPEDHLPRLLNQLRTRVYSSSTLPMTGNRIGEWAFSTDEGPAGAPVWWNGAAWVNANGIPTT